MVDSGKGIEETAKHRIVRACGAMETRQTTNLKIAGSTPARLVFFDTVKGSQGKNKST